MPSLPMPLTDSMFLIGETRNVPMHVGSLQLYSPPEGATGQEAIRAVQERWLHQKQTSEPFSKRAYRSPLTAGQWAWHLDEDVDLDYHLRRSALPSPGRPRELMELVGRLHATLLDRSRPLWETHLIEGMADGRYAIYSKLHHSVADGISGMRLTASALSPDPDARDLAAPWTPRPRRPRPGIPVQQQVRDAIGLAKDAVGVAPTVAKTVLRGLTSDEQLLPFQAPRSILNTSISSSRRFAAQSWELDRLKTVGKALDATVNDIVLAMSGGALRRYLQEQLALPDAPLVAMVPVALNVGDAERQGNAVGAVLCNLGTDRVYAADRLETIKQSMQSTKARLEGLSALEITALGAGLMFPAAAAGQLRLSSIARPAYNVVISNVPAGRQELYYDGAHLEAIYPLSIPQDGQALNITVIGQGRNVNFGLVGCRQTLPHLQRLLGHLEDELVALEQL